MITATFNVPLQLYTRFERKLDNIKKAFVGPGATFNYEFSALKTLEANFPSEGLVVSNDIPSNYPWAGNGREVTLGVGYVTVDLEWSSSNDNWDVVGIVKDDGKKLTYYSYDKKDPIPAEVRKRYKHLKCEHCKYIRDREKAFIVRNKETEEYKMIGTQCLEDYTGIRSAKGLEDVYELLENPPTVNAKKVDNNFQVFMYKVDEVLNYQFCKILSGDFTENSDETKKTIFAIYNITSNLKDHKRAKAYITEDNVQKATTLITEAKRWIGRINVEDPLYKENASAYRNAETAKIYSEEEKEEARIVARKKYISAEDVENCEKIALMYIYNTGKNKEERDRKIAEADLKRKNAEQFENYLNDLREKAANKETVELKLTDKDLCKIVDPELEKIGKSLYLNGKLSKENVVNTKEYPLIFKGIITEVDTLYIYGEGVIESDPRDKEKDAQKQEELRQKYEKAEMRADNIGEVGDIITIKIMNVSSEARLSKSSANSTYYVYHAEDDLGGHYSWFSYLDFNSEDIITGKIEQKSRDLYDKNLEVIYLREVKKDPEGTVGTRIPGEAPKAAATEIIAPMVSYKEGDAVNFEVRSLEKGEPYRIATKDYNLIPVVFTDARGQKYNYTTREGSFIDLNPGKIKGIRGIIKKIEGPSYRLKDVVVIH